MPKGLRKSEKGYKKSEAYAQPPTQEPEPIVDGGPSSGTSRIDSRVPDSIQDQVNSEAPFGFVDPYLKVRVHLCSDPKDTNTCRFFST